MPRVHGCRALALILSLPAVTRSATPDTWIPARWPGGPLEVERRAAAKTLPSDAALRETIENWYDPATLTLLDGSPVNCLLVTWSAGANAESELRQRELLQVYIDRARQRKLAILGLVYPGGDASKIAASAAEARLDGLVLDGQFPAGFTQQITTALLAASPSAVVIPIAGNAASARMAEGPVVAVEGISPSARNLTEMGIR